MNRLLLINKLINENVAEHIVEMFALDNPSTNTLYVKNPPTEERRQIWEEIEKTMYKEVFKLVDIYKEILMQQPQNQGENWMMEGLHKKHYIKNLVVCKYDATKTATYYHKFFGENDDELFTFSYFLNEVDEGGEVHYDGTTIQPKVGDLLLYPRNIVYTYAPPKSYPQFILLGQVYREQYTVMRIVREVARLNRPQHYPVVTSAPISAPISPPISSLKSAMAKLEEFADSGNNNVLHVIETVKDPPTTNIQERVVPQFIPSSIEHMVEGYRIKEYRPHNIYIVEDLFEDGLCDSIARSIETSPDLNKLEYTPTNNVLCFENNNKEIENTYRTRINNKVKILGTVMKYINNKIVMNYNSGYGFRKIFGTTREHCDNLTKYVNTTAVNYVQNDEDVMFNSSVYNESTNENNLYGRNTTMVIALNDDYDGGVFTFPYHGISLRIKKGSIIMFPPFWSHPHYVTAPENGTFRYTINTWSLQPIK